MQWLIFEEFYRSLLDQKPLFDDHHSIHSRYDGREIMGNHQERQMPFLTETVKKFQYFGLTHQIERCRDLIGQEEFRFADESHRQKDALALAPG